MCLEISENKKTMERLESEWLENGIGYWRTVTRWIECSTNTQFIFAISVWVDSARDFFFSHSENIIYLPESWFHIDKNKS